MDFFIIKEKNKDIFFKEDDNGCWDYCYSITRTKFFSSFEQAKGVLDEWSEDDSWEVKRVSLTYKDQGTLKTYQFTLE